MSPLPQSQSYAQSFKLKIFPGLIIGDFSTEKVHTVQGVEQGHSRLKMNLSLRMFGASDII